MGKDYMEGALWTDKKRTVFGLPISFTRYVLLEDKFLIRTGFLNIKEDEIRLYRIVDLSLVQRFSQRLFGVGTIICDSTDKSASRFEIKNIKKTRQVKELISQAVEEERDRKRVSVRENMIDHGGHDHDDDDFDFDDGIDHH